MERNKGLILLGLLLATTVLLTTVVLPTMADKGAYQFYCRDVVKYSHDYYDQQSTTIVPNNFGGATVTMPVNSIQFTSVELGSVPGDTYWKKVNNARRAIENGAQVDFYDSADGSYKPFKLSCWGELRIDVNTEPGTGVGGRIKTIIDGHDGYIYFHFPGTLVTKGTVQVNGEEIALTLFGYTPRYY